MTADELHALRWSDVHLDAHIPHVVAAPAAIAVARPAQPAIRAARVCTYCGCRTSATMCCGDETMPA